MIPSTRSTVSVEDRQAVLSALRALGGTGTVADVAGRSGLSVGRAEAALRAVIETHRGHMEATNSGELVYTFPGGVVPRDHIPLPTRIWRAMKAAAVWGFKAWTLVMLAGYSLVFAVLAVVALVALMAKSDDGWEGGAEILWIPLRILFEVWFWFGIPGLPEPRRPRRLGGKGKDPGPPIPERVFRFIFGPPDTSPSLEEKNRRGTALIRERAGVLSPVDLVRVEGYGLEEAEEELARLTVALAGDFEVSPKGEVVALFPELVMDSSRLRAREEPAALPPPDRRGRLPAGPTPSTPAPRPVWASVPPVPAFTGNPGGTDAWIVGANTFNLAASGFVLAGAGAAGAAITTVAGPGPLSAATWILGWIPLTFSALLFALPVLRIPGWQRRKEKRLQVEARGAVLRLMMEAAERGAAPALSAELVKARNPKLDPDRLRKALEQLSSEFEADVEPAPGGVLMHHFRNLPRILDEAEVVRGNRNLTSRQVGEVIYSSDDDPEEAARRELRRFDLDLDRDRDRGLGRGGEER